MLKSGLRISRGDDADMTVEFVIQELFSGNSSQILNVLSTLISTDQIRQEIVKRVDVMVFSIINFSSRLIFLTKLTCNNFY